MTSDGQPAPPGRLHPATAVVCADRPARAADGPLNTPIVLAPNFHAGEDGRAYSRTDATPEQGGAGDSRGPGGGRPRCGVLLGMAAIAAVLDLLPAGGSIVAPEDCYFGVGELLADAASTAAGPSTAWT